MCAVTRNKPFFDHIQGDGIGMKMTRVAIDTLVTRSDLRSQKIRLRWVGARQLFVD